MKESPRILIVDDDRSIGTMLKRSLTRHGFEVDSTSSADEALSLAETTAYDAALVDLVMPGRDGASLADELRRRIPGIPIGLLTGYRNSPLVPTAERAGAKLFPKPVIIQEVVEFLKTELD
jgi:two-component system, NtrC family, response regulator AtoC